MEVDGLCSTLSLLGNMLSLVRNGHKVRIREVKYGKGDYCSGVQVYQGTLISQFYRVLAIWHCPAILDQPFYAHNEP